MQSPTQRYPEVVLCSAKRSRFVDSPVTFMQGSNNERVELYVHFPIRLYGMHKESFFFNINSFLFFGHQRNMTYTVLMSANYKNKFRCDVRQCCSVYMNKCSRKNCCPHLQGIKRYRINRINRIIFQGPETFKSISL
jgi:glutaminase